MMVLIIIKNINSNIYINKNDGGSIKTTSGPGGGGGLPYIIDVDARRNFQKKLLKVTIFGEAPANFIP